MKKIYISEFGFGFPSKKIGIYGVTHEFINNKLRGIIKMTLEEEIKKLNFIIKEQNFVIKQLLEELKDLRESYNNLENQQGL